jgi:hypothetical protein
MTQAQSSFVPDVTLIAEGRKAGCDLFREAISRSLPFSP